MGRKRVVSDVKDEPGDLEKRRGQLLARLEELERLEAEYVAGNRIEFFKPIEPYQSKVLELIEQGKMVVTLQGGNGIGKTVMGSVVTGSACLGIHPWDKTDTRWGRSPVKVRVLCTDWEKHAAGVVVPKLKEWMPVGQYETHKNNLGIESQWRFGNSSELEIVTGKQDTRDLEGWEGDIVWADEPFSRDKFVALLRGLRKGKGLFLITMTAVSEPWILDDIVRNTHPSYASVTEIPMDANPYLTAEYKETFKASLKENEKIPRIYGGWINFIGLIWPSFKTDPHIIDDFRVPVDWPVTALIDWHISKPIAVGFYAVDNRDFHYVIDEIWRNGSAEEIADEIIRRKINNNWRMTEAFVDPLSKGDTAYVKNMGVEVKDSFTRLRDRLWTNGIELKVATKDKDSGIRNIEDMLKGVNGLPSLFFFRSLTNKIVDEGHIWEIQRWTYDEKTGKPRDENDHFMENLYRMTLTGTKYSDLRRTNNLRSETEFDLFKPNYGIREESQTEFNVWAR